MSDTKTLPEKLQKIATQIEELTVLEMSELASYLEEKFGVSGMPMMAAAPAAAGAAPAAEEKSSYTVVIADSGANKLNVIKVVRELVPTLGLMEAKKLAETTPAEVLKDVKKEVAEDAKKKLEAAGAKVELK